MPEFKLSAGATLDVLNKAELDRSLKDWDTAQAAAARAVKKLEFTGTLGAITIGPNTLAPILQTPQQGYIWSVRNLGILLQASANLRVFKVGDNTPNPPQPSYGPVGTSSNAQIGQFVTWSAGQCWLDAGQFLAVAATVAQAAGSGYALTVLEAPAEMAWKLTI